MKAALNPKTNTNKSKAKDNEKTVLVQVEAFGSGSSGGELRERWAAEALRWLLEGASRHLAARSHQVGPPLPSNCRSAMSSSQSLSTSPDHWLSRFFHQY
jgi:hypothetical protein